MCIRVLVLISIHLGKNPCGVESMDCCMCVRAWGRLSCAGARAKEVAAVQGVYARCLVMWCVFSTAAAINERKIVGSSFMIYCMRFGSCGEVWVPRREEKWRLRLQRPTACLGGGDVL